MINRAHLFLPPTIMRELHCDERWYGTSVGISSRTASPIWARELLTKFRVGKNDPDGLPPHDDDDASSSSSSFPLSDVLLLDDGRVEMASDAKAFHFERIRSRTGVPYDRTMFFDNERGNCLEVARQCPGVTVVYTPDGVTEEAWKTSVDAFPQTSGKIVGIDVC